MRARLCTASRTQALRLARRACARRGIERRAHVMGIVIVDVLVADPLIVPALVSRNETLTRSIPVARAPWAAGGAITGGW